MDPIPGKDLNFRETAFAETASGLSCLVCEDGNGTHVPCTDETQKEKDCGDHVVGCVEEVGGFLKQVNLVLYNPRGAG